jgi:hypothetical protein
MTMEHYVRPEGLPPVSGYRVHPDWRIEIEALAAI